MFSQLSVIGHQIDGKSYHLLCEPTSLISDTRKALIHFLKCLDEIEEKAREKEQREVKTEYKLKTECTPSTNPVQFPVDYDQDYDEIPPQ